MSSVRKKKNTHLGEGGKRICLAQRFFLFCFVFSHTALTKARLFWQPVTRGDALMIAQRLSRGVTPQPQQQQRRFGLPDLYVKPKVEFVFGSQRAWAWLTIVCLAISSVVLWRLSAPLRWKVCMWLFALGSHVDFNAAVCCLAAKNNGTYVWRKPVSILLLL